MSSCDYFSQRRKPHAQRFLRENPRTRFRVRTARSTRPHHRPILCFPALFVCFNYAPCHLVSAAFVLFNFQSHRPFVPLAKRRSFVGVLPINVSDIFISVSNVTWNPVAHRVSAKNVSRYVVDKLFTRIEPAFDNPQGFSLLLHTCALSSDTFFSRISIF